MPTTQLLINSNNKIISLVTIYDPVSLVSYNCNALWDTGSNNSCITQRVVAALNIQPTGIKKVVTTVGGQVTADTYDCAIQPAGHSAPFHIPQAALAPFPLNPYFDAIIGMDLIQVIEINIKNGIVTITT